MEPAKKQRAYYRTLLLSSLALVLGGLLLWSLNRPRYLLFSGKGVGPRHVALELYYPADWTPIRISNTYGWDNETVTLEHRRQSGLVQWMDEHFYHIGPQDWKSSTIQVQLISDHLRAGIDIDAEERRLQNALGQLAASGGEYSLQRANFPAGPALLLEIKNSRRARFRSASMYNSILLFPVTSPGKGRCEVAVAYYGTDRIKARYRQVALDIVSHLKLVEKK